MKDLKIIECPRDAMQGIKELIPTEKKVAYINSLLACGFDTIDFGSFVSPKAIPQMQDTKDVLQKLELTNSSSKLLAIIANTRGAEEAITFDEITYLGFPFSISETFQQRNTNSSIEASFSNLATIQNLCIKNNKHLVTYISMGFGNPYGDLWNSEIVADWSIKLHQELGIKILALSDTIGNSTPDLVANLFQDLIKAIPEVEFGAHLHTLAPNAWSLVKAAYENGCRRFDGAIKGFGGCPMAKDDLTGNMPTEIMLDYFHENQIETGIDIDLFNQSMLLANKIFPLNH
jgi:hydroxymethylglutaryl-CoA lyase